MRSVSIFAIWVKKPCFGQNNPLCLFVATVTNMNMSLNCNSSWGSYLLVSFSEKRTPGYARESRKNYIVKRPTGLWYNEVVTPIFERRQQTMSTTLYNSTRKLSRGKLSMILFLIFEIDYKICNATKSCGTNINI